MRREELERELRAWVTEKEANGVIQHSDDWKGRKVFTVGGSSLATIQGVNPYSSVFKMLREKIGLEKFKSDIKPQWGNLFEDVIKRYVEHDRGCTIYGEDLYVEGAANTSYSPDGLAVMDIDVPAVVEVESDTGIELVERLTRETAIVLVEFKCPFSRIPSGRVPNYYIPQVKMGLDLLNLPTHGLFIEGVFRRCSWEQLNFGADYDRSLTPRSSGKLPLAIGIIGFYITKENYDVSVTIETMEQEGLDLPSQFGRMNDHYIEHYGEFGDASNGFICNDIGNSPPELFKEIMGCYDAGLVTPWFGNIAFAAEQETSHEIINSDLEAFTNFCREPSHINLGVLPWKLFRLDYNTVTKTPGYLEPWMPQINDLINCVRECLDPVNAGKQDNIIAAFAARSGGGFSDD